MGAKDSDVAIRILESNDDTENEEGGCSRRLDSMHHGEKTVTLKTSSTLLIKEPTHRLFIRRILEIANKRI